MLSLLQLMEWLIVFQCCESEISESLHLVACKDRFLSQKNSVDFRPWIEQFGSRMRFFVSLFWPETFRTFLALTEIEKFCFWRGQIYLYFICLIWWEKEVDSLYLGPVGLQISDRNIMAGNNFSILQSRAGISLTTLVEFLKQLGSAPHGVRRNFSNLKRGLKSLVGSENHTLIEKFQRWTLLA